MTTDAKFAAWKEKLGPKLPLEIKQFGLLIMWSPYFCQLELTGGERSHEYAVLCLMAPSSLFGN